MNSDLTTDDRDVLDNYTEALEAAGVPFSIEYRVSIEEPEIIPTDDILESSDGGETVHSRSNDSVGLPAENTKSYAIAESIATHDKEWVTIEDLTDTFGSSQSISGHLTHLFNRRVVQRRNEGQNTPQPTEYRVKELYRRELLAESDKWTGEIEI